MDRMLGKDRLRLLLDQFGSVGDPREAAKVRYPLRQVLFLVTCATISGCDDYDEIADWGAHHLDFLMRYSEYSFGIPKEEWLRAVLNRIDPALFEACFTAWARSLRPDGPDTIALDGKTLRRSRDRAVGQKPLHLVSVWASSQRLVLSQEAVDAKANEGAAILTLLERMPLKGKRRLVCGRDRFQQDRRPAAVLNIGTMHGEANQKASCIGDDVALAPVDALTGIVAINPVAFGGFYRLRVDHAGRRIGRAPVSLMRRRDEIEPPRLYR